MGVLLMLYHSQVTDRSARDGHGAFELDIGLRGIQPFYLWGRIKIRLLVMRGQAV